MLMLAITQMCSTATVQGVVGYGNDFVSKLSRGLSIPAVLNLAEKLPFMDSRVIRSRSAVCMFCPASGEVGVMVPEEAAFAAS